MASSAPTHTTLLSADAGSNTDINTLNWTSIAAAAASNNNETFSPSATNSALDLKRSSQRQFTKQVRDELYSIIQHRGEIFDDQIFDNIIIVQKQEKKVRRRTEEIGEIIDREQLMRYELTRRCLVAFELIQKQKKDETLIPWCTNSCRYCCMSRPNWETHVRLISDFNFSLLQDSEERCRNEIQYAEIAQFFAITCSKDVTVQQLHLVSGQSKALLAEELCTRGEIEVTWFKDFNALRSIHSEKKVLWDTKAYANELRNKQIEVHREHERLHIVEVRASRQVVIMCSADESSRRGAIESAETVKYQDILNKFSYRYNELRANEWRLEVKTALLERDTLLKFRDDTIRERAEALEEQQKKQKAELEREFRELRKLRKAGAQTGDSLPPCHRCHQVPAKDLTSHRLNECPERPTQCIKCELILPMSAADSHKDTCPARILQCPHCFNFFKASYLTQVHSASRCAAVKDAMIRLERSQPTLRITVAKDVDQFTDLDDFFEIAEGLFAPPSLSSNGGVNSECLNQPPSGRIGALLLNGGGGLSGETSTVASALHTARPSDRTSRPDEVNPFVNVSDVIVNLDTSGDTKGEGGDAETSDGLVRSPRAATAADVDASAINNASLSDDRSQKPSQLLGTSMGQKSKRSPSVVQVIAGTPGSNPSLVLEATNSPRQPTCDTINDSAASPTVATTNSKVNRDSVTSLGASTIVGVLGGAASSRPQSSNGGGLGGMALSTLGSGTTVSSRLPPNATPAQVQQMQRLQTLLSNNQAVAEDVRSVISRLSPWVPSSTVTSSMPITPTTEALDFGGFRGSIGGSSVSSSPAVPPAASAFGRAKGAKLGAAEVYLPPVSINAIPIELPSYLSPFEPPPPPVAAPIIGGSINKESNSSTTDTAPAPPVAAATTSPTKRGSVAASTGKVSPSGRRSTTTSGSLQPPPVPTAIAPTTALLASDPTAAAKASAALDTSSGILVIGGSSSSPTGPIPTTTKLFLSCATNQPCGPLVLTGGMTLLATSVNVPAAEVAKQLEALNSTTALTSGSSLPSTVVPSTVGSPRPADPPSLASPKGKEGAKETKVSILSPTSPSSKPALPAISTMGPITGSTNHHTKATIYPPFLPLPPASTSTVYITHIDNKPVAQWLQLCHSDAMHKQAKSRAAAAAAAVAAASAGDTGGSLIPRSDSITPSRAEGAPFSQARKSITGSSILIRRTSNNTSVVGGTSALNVSTDGTVHKAHHPHPVVHPPTTFAELIKQIEARYAVGTEVVVRVAATPGSTYHTRATGGFAAATASNYSANTAKGTAGGSSKGGSGDLPDDAAFENTSANGDQFGSGRVDVFTGRTHSTLSSNLVNNAPGVSVTGPTGASSPPAAAHRVQSKATLNSSKGAGRSMGANLHSVVYFPPTLSFDLMMVVGSTETNSVAEFEQLKFLVLMDTAQYCKPTPVQLAEGAGKAGADGKGSSNGKGAAKKK